MPGEGEGREREGDGPIRLMLVLGDLDEIRQFLSWALSVRKFLTTLSDDMDLSDLFSVKNDARRAIADLDLILTRMSEAKKKTRAGG